MPAHTILSTGTVVIGASAGLDDLRDAMRAAVKEQRVVRLHAVETLGELQYVAALAANYGWSPSFSWPSFGCVDIVDLHLGGGL